MTDSIFDGLHYLVTIRQTHHLYVSLIWSVIILIIYQKKKSVIILILCFVFQTTFNCIKIGKFHFSILYLLMSMQICKINIMKRCLNLPQNKLLMAFILCKLQLSALLKTNNCIAIFPVHWRWSSTWLIWHALHLLLLVLYSIFISLICISSFLIFCSMRRIRYWPMYISKQN